MPLVQAAVATESEKIDRVGVQAPGDRFGVHLIEKFVDIGEKIPRVVFLVYLEISFIELKQGFKEIL